MLLFEFWLVPLTLSTFFFRTSSLMASGLKMNCSSGHPLLPTCCKLLVFYLRIFHYTAFKFMNSWVEAIKTSVWVLMSEKGPYLSCSGALISALMRSYFLLLMQSERSANNGCLDLSLLFCCSSTFISFGENYACDHSQTAKQSFLLELLWSLFNWKTDLPCYISWMRVKGPSGVMHWSETKPGLNQQPFGFKPKALGFLSVWSWLLYAYKTKIVILAKISDSTLGGRFMKPFAPVSRC